MDCEFKIEFKIGDIVNWRQIKGFQNCWLWQFGVGPFEIVDVSPVKATPSVLGTDAVTGATVEINFEPGQWITIAVPRAAYQYRVEYQIKTVMFHSKWLE